MKEIFFELEEKGANNINLVTGTHFIPQIAEALKLAKKERCDNMKVLVNGCNGKMGQVVCDLIEQNKNLVLKYY